MLRLSALVLLVVSVIKEADLCLPGYNTLTHGICLGYKGCNSPSEANYAKVKALCDSEGTHLVTIRTASEMYSFYTDVFAELCGGAMYLGLECVGGEYQWYDGEPMTYSNFAQPDNPDDNKDDGDGCKPNEHIDAHMDSDMAWVKLSDEYYETMYMCQEHDVISNPECGGFEITDDDGHACYHIGRETNLTSSQSDLVCQNQFAKLASIHSLTMNNFLRRQAIAMGITSTLLIGAVNAVDVNNFAWSDGSITNFQNFAPENPDPTKGQCVGMSATDGRWISVSCDQQQRYICSRPKPSTLQPLAPVNCPVNVTYHRGDHIYSSNFPISVLSGVFCEYHIEVPEGQSASIQIVYFETNFYGEYLEVHDGPIPMSTYRISGSNLVGKNYTVSGNVMRLVWKPWEAIRVRGWHVVVL